jgi:hypothetical protein
MIQIEILPLKNAAAVLAGVPITLKNIVPRELDLFLWQPVEKDEQNDPRNTNPEGNGVDAFGVGLLLREIVPLVEIESSEGTIFAIQDHMRPPFKQKRERPPGRADIDCLPQAV